MKVRGTDFVAYEVSDIDKSMKFYRDTLGMNLEEYVESWAWAEFTATPTTLAVYSPLKLNPPREPNIGGAAIALAVEDIQESVEELKSRGVEFVFEPFESPVCHIAAIKDPDGNVIMLHQRKDGSFG